MSCQAQYILHTWSKQLSKEILEVIPLTTKICDNYNEFSAHIIQTGDQKRPLFRLFDKGLIPAMDRKKNKQMHIDKINEFMSQKLQARSFSVTHISEAEAHLTKRARSFEPTGAPQAATVKVAELKAKPS